MSYYCNLHGYNSLGAIYYYNEKIRAGSYLGMKCQEMAKKANEIAIKYGKGVSVPADVLSVLFYQFLNGYKSRFHNDSAVDYNAAAIATYILPARASVLTVKLMNIFKENTGLTSSYAGYKETDSYIKSAIKPYLEITKEITDEERTRWEQDQINLYNENIKKEEAAAAAKAAKEKAEKEEYIRQQEEARKEASRNQTGAVESPSPAGMDSKTIMLIAAAGVAALLLLKK